jgi:hypothetical protein
VSKEKCSEQWAEWGLFADCTKFNEEIELKILVPWESVVDDVVSEVLDGL